VVQRSLKVIENGTIYDFLLVADSNLPHIFYRCRDIATMTMTSSADRNQYGKPTVVAASGRNGVDVGASRQRVLFDQLSLIVVIQSCPRAIIVAEGGPRAGTPRPRPVARDDQPVAVDVDVELREH